MAGRLDWLDPDGLDPLAPAFLDRFIGGLLDYEDRRELTARGASSGGGGSGRGRGAAGRSARARSRVAGVVEPDYVRRRDFIKMIDEFSGSIDDRSARAAASHANQ